MRIKLIFALLFVVVIAGILGSRTCGIFYIDDRGIHVRFLHLTGTHDYGAYIVRKGQRAKLIVNLSGGKLEVTILNNLHGVYSRCFNSSCETEVLFCGNGLCMLRLKGYSASGSVDLIIEKANTSNNSSRVM